MRSALEWAQVRAMAADGVSQREIARRLGINRRTVRRLVEASEPPRYARAPAGSMLDPLEPVMRRAAGGVAGDQGAAGDGDPARGLRLRGLGRSGPQAAGAAAAAAGAAGAADGLSAGAGAAGRLGARCRRGRGSPAASGGSTR